MLRTFVIGLLLFVAFAVAFAPASLIRTLLPAGGDIELLEPAGTLWNGRGRVLLAGQSAGTVDWQFRAAALLRGRLGYAVELTGPEHRLSGRVSGGPSAGEVMLSGTVGATAVNRWLAVYDIAISGTLTLSDVALTVPYDPARLDLGNAAGSASWEGGPIRYRLAGRSYDADLPPLVALLGDGLTAAVFPRDGQTPLLNAAILPNGFAKVGITQLLTKLVGNPWPGSHQDHEVVLEVEEHLF